MQQTYLIKLRNDSTKEDFARVSELLKNQGVKALIASIQGFWFIAPLNQNLASEIKKMRKVELVGGVTLKKREIKKIRTPKM